MDIRFHYGLIAVAKVIGIDLSSHCRNWLNIYNSRKKFRGKVDAVKFMKELNTVAERYALHQPISPIPWTKSDNDGFPKIINFAKQSLRSQDPKQVVMTLSVFRSVEDLRLPISKDISTVTQPCSYDTDLVSSIIDFIPEWLSRFTPIKLSKIKYHFTLKNGPNGHALKESDKDILAVMNDTKLYEAIRKVEHQLLDTRPMKEVSPITGDFIHSKLTQFPDKSGKTRTIAIIDYYSQRCLKPLHDGLMAFLGKLVSDGTYSHQNVGKFAQQMTATKQYIYCSDLTAFTDRFPSIIQRELLFNLLEDKELSKAMWTLLAERTFRLSWCDDIISYGCGQPMGAYASWALCTLAHHLIVEYSAKLVDKANIQHLYRIIGDDNIITDEKTGQKYQEILKQLNVPINRGKTVESPKDSEFSGAEVAKQLYLNGICLTPLTPGFIRLMRKPYMFNACLAILRDRYEFFETETPSMLINEVFRKEDVRKLVWLLGTNPISGNIKPTDVGYDINCPWDASLRSQYEENYRKIVIDAMIDQAQSNVDSLMDDFEDFLDQEIDYLDFSNLDFSKITDFAKQQAQQGSLWNDSTRPEPQCYSEIRLAIEHQLTNVINGLSGVTRDIPLKDIVAEFDFVPDPKLPYQDRKEMRQRRMSSYIVKLFNYNDTIQFTTIEW